jgi:hypothetical protein
MIELVHSWVLMAPFYLFALPLSVLIGLAPIVAFGFLPSDQYGALIVGFFGFRLLQGFLGHT